MFASRFALFFLCPLLVTTSLAFAQGGGPDPIVGTWESSVANGSATLRLKLDENGDGLMHDTAIRWRREGQKLTVFVGFETFTYDISLQGNELTVEGGDLPRKLVFTRKAAARGLGGRVAQPGNSQDPPAPITQPRKPATIVGVWNDGNETAEFRADGVCLVAGLTLQYELTPDTLILKGAGGSVPAKYKLDGDTLTVTFGDQTSVYRRVRPGEAPPPVNAGGNAPEAAGVYVGTESSIDPTNVMTFTQIVTLFPDGSVGWAKIEGGATRAQISEHLERFTSFRNQQNNRGEVFGTWQSSGNEIAITWTRFGNTISRGTLNPQTGKVTWTNMGVLNEGAPVEFQRR